MEQMMIAMGTNFICTQKYTEFDLFFIFQV